MPCCSCPRRHIRQNCSHLIASHCMILNIHFILFLISQEKYLKMILKDWTTQWHWTRDSGIASKWNDATMRYSVTQSYQNSFWGDVVLDTFHNVSRDEDNILAQIYIKKIFSNFYYEVLKFYEWLRKKYIQRNSAFYKKELIKLGFSDNPILVCIFKIIILKIRTYLLDVYLV